MGPDLIQNVQVENFVQNYTENGPIGIKDLVDLQNDKFELDIEALKCKVIYYYLLGLAFKKWWLRLVIYNEFF
jgi:hypothetical protein